MADPAMVQLLANRDNFLNSLRLGMLPILDFSNEQIKFDFSGLTLTGTNFAYCDLTGSKFANTQLSECHFDLSNWAGCDFSNATFSQCYLSGVRKAHKAIGLHISISSFNI
jgi:uncharacterized protein YjbI with pentapeptide repeats